MAIEMLLESNVLTLPSPFLEGIAPTTLLMQISRRDPAAERPNSEECADSQLELSVKSYRSAKLWPRAPTLKLVCFPAWLAQQINPDTD